MQIPPQITIREIPDSAAIEAQVAKKISKLEKICNHIISCKVVIDIQQKHKHQGKLFSTHIDLTIPGKEIVVTRVINEDLYVAIRDAFNAARRQLENYMAKQQGEVKTHQIPMQGYVARLFPNQAYGFITGQDNTDYYFDALNVAVPDFEHLTIGTHVEFFVMVGNEGPQAMRVTAMNL
ncbi:MAG: HPF/RaiA family ribosome-associated protein [Gammaproteobacteria bacterium]